MFNAKLFSMPICLIVLTISVKVFAQAGPPLIGDDPGTPGDGHWEINLAYTHEKTPMQTTSQTPNIDISYGLGDHAELSYQGAWLMGKDNDQNWQTGYDDSVVGTKWRFLDQDKNVVDMSVYPQLEFNTTRSLARTGLIDSGTSLFLPVEIARTFGKLELDAEAGYQFISHGRDSWATGIVIGYQLTGRIELLAEAREVIDQDFRHDTLILDSGARIKLTEQMSLLFAAGRAVRNQDDSPTLYVYAGVGFNF